jgi:ketosteroid isomerase-like protein
MRFAACAATSHEIAATLGGDDIVVRARGDLIDASRPLADVAVVRSGFEAFAKGDVAGFAQMFHADATWQHRNDDRPGGVHRGTDGIMSFLAESGQLTGGTLRAVPQAFMADGAGRVAVLVQVSGRRPDGRSFDVPQVLLFSVGGDRVRTVDQYVGDPAAVAAFWA